MGFVSENPVVLLDLGVRNTTLFLSHNHILPRIVVTSEGLCELLSLLFFPQVGIMSKPSSMGGYWIVVHEECMLFEISRTTPVITHGRPRLYYVV